MRCGAEMGKGPNPYYLIRIIPAEGAFTKAELFRCFFAGSSIRDDLIFLEENCMKNQNTRRLVESALMIAIGTVLSELKVGSLWAFGGGLTIGSMVPLVLISHRWGIKWGTFTAFVYSLLQLILGVDNVQYATSVGMAIAIILLDYIIAYTVIGLSSMFGSSRPAIIGGVVVTLGLRFLCHFLTGWMIWDALWPNEFGMTSAVNVIGVTELYYFADVIKRQNFKQFQTYVIVCAIYFVLTFTVTRLLRLLERRLEGRNSYTVFGSQTDPDAEIHIKTEG